MISNIDKGKIYAILSALTGLLGATLLAKSALTYDVLTIALIWYTASLAINALYLTITKSFIIDCLEIKKHWQPMTLVIVLGILEGALWFYAFNLIGLSGMAITGRLSLVLITIYSIYFLKETDDTIEIACMFIICIASLSLFFNIEANTQTWHYLIAFGAATISFLYTISLKHISQKSAPTAVHFFRALGILTIYGISYATIHGTLIPDLTVFTITAFTCLTIGGISSGFITQLFRFRSFQFHCPLYVYKTITASIPAASFLIGVLLIDEPSSTQKWIIASIVLSASALITYRQYINNKKEPNR